MLLESEMIKQHKPIFNRRLRKSLFPFGLFDEFDENGYLRLVIGSTSKYEANPIIHFNSRQEAANYLMSMAEKNEFCQKLCGLYNSKNGCFQYDLKKCKGACVREEKSESYNERVSKFISKLTFDGRSFYI